MPDTDPAEVGRSADVQAGDVLGACVIRNEVGRGAMGVVYRAHDATLDRDVAVKVMWRRATDDPGYLERLTREARIMARIEHPNVLAVHSAGTHAGHAYLVMQLVNGESLAARLEREGALPVAEALRITREAALALEAASEAGIIHRDIKPDNLLLDGRGHVKVTDFGLSRDIHANVSLTSSSDYVGTPRYSSPEQWCNQELDVRSDIYSLGVCLYEMLTGKPPFDAPSLAALMQQILGGEVTSIDTARPDIPAPVSRLLEKMMASSRDARFDSPAALVRELDRIGGATSDDSVVAPRAPEGGPGGSCKAASAPPSADVTPAVPPTRGSFRALAAAALLALVAAATWFFVRPPPAPPPPPPTSAV